MPPLNNKNSTTRFKVQLKAFDHQQVVSTELPLTSRGNKQIALQDKKPSNKDVRLKSLPK